MYINWKLHLSFCVLPKDLISWIHCICLQYIDFQLKYSLSEFQLKCSDRGNAPEKSSGPSNILPLFLRQDLDIEEFTKYADF